MSDDRASESLAYYASHGPITDPALHAAAFAGLPADIRALTRAVQGLVFHYFADEKIFGWRPPKDRLPEIDTRRVRAMLARLAALDPRPLAEARPPERRLVGCCRDFTVLLCAMARHHGIPIRALVDEIAERTQAADGFADVQQLYARSGLAVPERIRSLSPVVGPHEVALGAEL